MSHRHCVHYRYLQEQMQKAVKQTIELKADLREAEKREEALIEWLNAVRRVMVQASHLPLYRGELIVEKEEESER